MCLHSARDSAKPRRDLELSFIDTADDAASPSNCNCDASDAADPAPVNMSHLLADPWTQADPQRSCVKDDAFMNISSIMLTRDTSHFEMSILNDFAPINMAGVCCTFDTSHSEMSLLNTRVNENMRVMSFTFDTSHFDKSPSNDLAPQNIRDMSCTLDTSHFEMSPLKDSALKNM